MTSNMTSKTQLISRFMADHNPPTPCLIIDTNRVAENYHALQESLPMARVYYAVKANPGMPVLRRLNALGSSFDAASVEEIDYCLQAGATPDRISYGSTIKKASAIRAARDRGVTMFAFDSAEELEKLAENAPGSRVYCRIAVANEGADWPLCRKFGTTIELAAPLLKRAAATGLDPYGVSFHVGSQQTNPIAYANAIRQVAPLYQSLAADGIVLRMINLGGGFPTQYRDPIPPIADFGRTIDSAIRDYFSNAASGAAMPEILLEPGRFISGDAGVLCAEVVLVSQSRDQNEPMRWVYLDVGRFGGLAETEGEAIKYRIETPYDGQETAPAVVAGPTCDGVDVMYEKSLYQLPKALRSGDRVTFLNAGAYVSCYASQHYNGFPAPQEHYLPEA